MGELEKREAKWRREFLRAALLEGAARLAAVVIGMIVAAEVADAALALPLLARWAVFCSMAAAMAAGFFFFLVSPVLRMDASGLLREAAARYPDLAPFLIPAWELARSERDSRTSEALVGAHVRQTERVLSGKGPLSVFKASLSKGARNGLAGVCVCSGIFMPWLYRNSPGLGRILTPWNDVPFATWVDVSPGSQRVAWGASVAVEARLKIRSAENPVSLWLKTSGSPWSRVDWDAEDSGRYSFRVSELTQPTYYQVRWRDQRSPEFLLEPIPFPRLAGMKARVHLPGAQAAGAPTDIRLEDAGGELEALRGSWIIIHGKPTAPLSRAQLRVSFLGSPVELKPSAGGEVEGGFPVTDDGDFRLDLESTDGIADPHPVSYRIKALADQPPTIDVLSPAFDVEASPRDALPIAFAAHDDFGLTSVNLLYRIPGRPEESVPLRRFANAPTDHIGDYSWDLSGLPLGARVEFRLQAVDNCPTGRQFGYSKPVVVRLVDFESGHASVEQRWLAAEKKVGALADKEQMARELSNRLGKTATPQQAQQLSQELSSKESELARDWAQNSQELQQFAEAMSKDPYANPGMTETAKALAQDFAATSQEQVPKAAQASGRGDWKEAEKRHADLEATARKAQNLLNRGQEMQGLQDYWSDAQRMDQQGQNLADALSKAAKDSGHVSAADRRKLDQALKGLQDQIDAMTKQIESMAKSSTSSAENRRKKYVVPLKQAAQTADRLRKAMERGDYSEAAKLAQQLSEELAQVRQSIADAAQAAAQESESGGGGNAQNALSKRMSEAMAKWQGAIDDQSKSLEQAQKAADLRTQSLIEAQKKFLDQLAARQQAAVSQAESLGVVFPMDALQWMRGALLEFKSKSVSHAPDFLKMTVQRLDLQAQADPSNAPAIQAVDDKEREILNDLTKGVPPPEMDGAQLSAASSAAAAEGHSRQMTQDLEGELRQIAAEAGSFSSKMVEPVEQAGGEQDAAASDLGRRDVPSGVRREQKALDLLEQGLKDMSSALEQQQRIESGQTSPFSGGRASGAIRRSGGDGGQSGADMGFVPLPSKEEYQPTQEMREELEKSLQEKRSPAYDKVIKDYFKRISE